jgi:hypothetical protein
MENSENYLLQHVQYTHKKNTDVTTPLPTWARKKINLCELWTLNKKGGMVSLNECSRKIIVAHG